MNMKYEELLLFLIFGSARWLSWCFDLRHGVCFGFDKTYILQLKDKWLLVMIVHMLVGQAALMKIIVDIGLGDIFFVLVSSWVGY
jgi:hypothetical protein